MKRRHNKDWRDREIISPDNFKTMNKNIEENLFKDYNFEPLRLELERKLGCTIQHTGWPCNTCFHNMNINLKEDIHEYWLSVLAVRGDYREDIDLIVRMDLIIELYKELEKWEK